VSPYSPPPHTHVLVRFAKLSGADPALPAWTPSEVYRCCGAAGVVDPWAAANSATNAALQDEFPASVFYPGPGGCVRAPIVLCSVVHQDTCRCSPGVAVCTLGCKFVHDGGPLLSVFLSLSGAPAELDCQGWLLPCEDRIAALHANLNGVLDMSRHAAKWTYVESHRAAEAVQVSEPQSRLHSPIISRLRTLPPSSLLLPPPPPLSLP
jgi:hypothetical protein